MLLKIQHGGNCHLENIKNMISLKSFGPILAEFLCDDVALPSLSAKNVT